MSRAPSCAACLPRGPADGGGSPEPAQALRRPLCCRPDAGKPPVLCVTNCHERGRWTGTERGARQQVESGPHCRILPSSHPSPGLDFLWKPRVGQGFSRNGVLARLPPTLPHRAESKGYSRCGLSGSFGAPK